MTVLIVAESSFGNTLAIADLIASGVARARGRGAVSIVRSGDAPHDVPAEVDLLLVGAPTHDFSMPKRQSRAQAVAKGAADGDTVGVREWIDLVTPRADLRVVTFDTSVKMRFTLGSASKAAAKALKQRGFRNAERGQSFYVTGIAGPLVDDEKQRAEAWGAQLAGSPRT